ncbi:MAG TPA: hypothetical protein VM073_07855 [Usitatibacter sp.]|nr:hypothetical protein [Usitatibacter sp.]
MKAVRIALIATALLPCAALAQAYSPREAPMSREMLRTCMERDASMRDRLDLLESERLEHDRETQAIERDGARIAEELRNLDSRDASAVAAYNARSAAHNRRVEVHNRRVADMNARAALHNGDASDLAAQCASRPYLLRDRDAVLRNGSIR